MSSGTTEYLTGVSFADVRTGIATGRNGTILRTNDAGATWTTQQSGTQESLFGVSFGDSHNGTIVGVNGTILHSSDGGQTWSSQSSGTLESMYGVYFADAEKGTAVGDGGLILNTTSGGTVWVEDRPSPSIPEELVLRQNYPNPFNPSTTIEYEVPSQSNVSLKVYDVLGRLVQVLIEEQKSAGTYIATFDGSKLSSGIYIYRLRVGELCQAKKLVLIK